MGANVMEVLANYDPNELARRGQKHASDLAATQAEIEQRRALTGQTKATTEQEQIKTDLLKRDLKDQAILRDAMINAPTAEDPQMHVRNVLNHAAKNGISGPGYFAAQKNLMDIQKSAAAITGDELKNQAAAHAQVGDILQGYRDAAKANPAVAPQLWSAAHARLEKLEPGAFAAAPPSEADLNYNLAAHGMTGKLLEQGLKQAQTTEAVARTAEANAKVPGEKAESEKKQLVTDYMKQAQADPTKGAALIDAAIPSNVDAQANSSYKAAWQAAMQSGNPEAAAHVVAAAAGHAAEISKANNPTVRAGKVADAVAIETATAPIKTAVEVQKQIALAKLSPDAFGSIQDNRSRQSAITNYEKDSKEYAQQAGDAARLRDFVSAAQSGNKAAPGLIPITELRGLVNRVNRQELEAVSGGGNLLDKIQGKIGALKEGQPIPPDLLEDIAGISNTMEKAARRTYEYKVSVINQTYGAKAKPIDLPGSAGPPEIKSQAEYDKLPKGAQYMHNGEVLTKK